MLGADPAERGLEPSFDPATVRRVLAPRQVPEQIVEALTEYRAALGGDVPIEYVELAAASGAAVSELSEPHGHAEHEPVMHDHGQHDESHAAHGHGVHSDGHAEHPHGDGEAAGHHDHHDMMAIVGEPSADGLVMEPIRLSYGPIGIPLPGGLVVDVTLDGDVVAESEVRALLSVDRRTRVPDLLSPVAWAVATTDNGASAATTSPWLRIAAVEVERAVSHLAWLRSLGRLLAFQPLIERCTRTLAALQVSRRVLPEHDVTEAWLLAAVGQGDLDDCRERIERLVAWLGRSRSLRWRLGGHGVITPARAHELGLRGPVARASAVEDDARTSDPLYRELSFAPVVDSRGDALARACVRGEEALAAVGLALDALALEYVGADAPVTSARAPVVIEGPRGLVTAARGSRQSSTSEPAAAGAATRRAAGDSMIGSEWSAALVALVSFDLSPWSVDS